MSNAGEAFFTAIGCMDGRVQEPIVKFGRKKFKAKYPDTITEAGLVGQLSRLRQGSGGQAQEEADSSLMQSIRRKIFISIERHHSKGVIIHGHQDCAGNPISDAEHKQDVIKASEIIRSFVPDDISVIPVFVENINGKWIAKEL